MKYGYILLLLALFNAAFSQSGLHPKWVNDTEVIYYDRSGKIWIHNIESRQRKELTQGSQPAPNPRLPGIYALRKRSNGRSGIVIMDEKKPDDLLMIDPKVAGLNSYHPIWSFDGNYLAFNAEHPENKTSTLYIYDYQKKSLQSYLEDRTAGAPSFFPNGDVLLPTYKGETFSLIRFNMKTGETTTLSSDDTRYFFADVAPDGNRVVVGMTDKENPENYDLWMLDLRTDQKKKLTDTPTKEFCGRWSPSGKKLLVFSEMEGTYHVLVMGINGQNVINLTASANED